MRDQPMDAGRRMALVSVIASASLAAINITSGLLSGSTAVLAAGLEFAGDVLASIIVFLGMWVASRPPDEDHPYGHGRFEILAGLLVGLILILGGIGISFHSLRQLARAVVQPHGGGLWAPILAVFAKSGLAYSKFRVGRRIGSGALIADAWNDSVDIISASAAITALTLTVHDPAQFGRADAYGGFAVGMIVLVTGVRVVRDAALELTDTMPSPKVLDEIRRIAAQIPQVENVEKCFARKTGLQYHVDLHIEVDSSMTVAQSHEIAHEVQQHVMGTVPYVAGVLVHIEPFGHRGLPRADKAVFGDGPE